MNGQEIGILCGALRSFVSNNKRNVFGNVVLNVFAAKNDKRKANFSNKKIANCLNGSYCIKFDI